MATTIGVIGTGEMGRSHLRLLSTAFTAQVTCAAICDPHPSNLRAARRIVPDAAPFTCAQDLLAMSELDAVAIVTPNDTHADLATAALAAGKFVYLEKPVATTVADCHRILAAAQAHERWVMIGHELHYAPIYQRIKQMIEHGDLGQPHLLWCREFRSPFHKKVENWIQDSRRSGGAIVEKNCHHFELMNWWCDSRPSRVAALGGTGPVRVLNSEHEVLDHASVTFEYDNRVRGNLMLCMFAPRQGTEHLQMGVVGDQGMVETRLSRRELWFWPRTANGQQLPIVHSVDAEGWSDDAHDGAIGAYQAFLQAIADGLAPPTDVSRCVDATLLAIAAEQSIVRRQFVEVARAASSVTHASL